MGEPTQTEANRWPFVITGLLAGLAVWLLVDVLPDRDVESRVILALATLAAGIFVPLLAMLGPLSLRRAAMGAGVVGVAVAVLTTTASYRFETVEGFLRTGHPIAALSIAIALPVPYLIVGIGSQGRFLDYPALFDAAWAAFVRALAAGAFTGTFWLTLWLSNALLGLVGVEVIEELLEIEPVPYLLTGLAVGIGTAVAHEMSDFVSPRLPIRLLRLLQPVVLIVTVIFLLALPFRGLSGLLGGLSTATTLIAMAWAAAAIITATLDRDDENGAHNMLMRRSAQALSLCLSILGLLAVYSVIARVGQYGWSPDRLAAMSAAVAMAAYGLAYALAIFDRGGWRSRIRNANAWLGLAVLAVAVAWLSPLLNAQKLSASNQVARFANGSVSADDIDLWEIGRQWGRPGERAIDDLLATVEPDSLLAQRIAALRDSPSRRDFAIWVEPSDRAAAVARLETDLRVLPEGAMLPPGFLDNLEAQDAVHWSEACARRTPAGNPGCVALRADFFPSQAGQELLVFISRFGERVEVHEFDAQGDRATVSREHWMRGPSGQGADRTVIDRILDGAFTVGPPSINTLQIGGVELFVFPR